MSGSESSSRGGNAPEPAAPAGAPAGSGAIAADTGLLSFAVHSLPSPAAAGRDVERTRRGRWQMIVVLLACAAPVIVSYFTYFVVRPDARTNYAELVLPPRPLPPTLSLRDLRGEAVAPRSLAGQWLLVAVAPGACDADCERLLVLQRQLHQSLGAARDRVDKVWLIDDAQMPRPETLAAIGAGAAPAGIAKPIVLRADRTALGRWLGASPEAGVPAQLHVVDPRGEFMMRAPAGPDPARLKRDLDRLLRASASWDRAGRDPVR